tara:strand:- start:118 stop:738 length:621 start_codon:yes stop_codon:yes gene_type:complete
MSFKKNKYKILKGAVSKELAAFIYSYLLQKRKVARFLFDQKYISPFTDYWGIWTDPQVPNTYSQYGDGACDVLLTDLKEKMEKETGCILTETYSYTRVYKRGDILQRHIDRDACEVSATLNLGGDPWPIYMDPTGKKGKPGIKVDLKAGDLLVYSGCDLEHWRQAFQGDNCGQVFLHYNTKNRNKYDGRPFLGLPTFFKDFTLPSK